MENSFTTDGKNKIDDNTSTIWYHGSPNKLEYLKQGSSITRNKKLAIAFSYKPSYVSVNNDGSIDHDGNKKGYLYKINEEINYNDIKKHPSCLDDDPWEYKTERNLRIIETK
jgi:hypothetical protein